MIPALIGFSLLGLGCCLYVVWAVREIEREIRELTERDPRTLPSDFHINDGE